MASFSSLLSVYRKLDALARREKDRSEYHDDRAFWVGLGVATAVALGLLSTFLGADSRTSLIVASVSSAITIPAARKVANYLWTRKVERFSTCDWYLDNEKLNEEHLRREIAKIKSLDLSERQATPLLVEAYKESLRMRKYHLKNEGLRNISDTRPEVWNYIPSETRKTQDRLLEEETTRKKERERQKRIRTEMEHERIANEIKKIEGR